MNDRHIGVAVLAVAFCFIAATVYVLYKDGQRPTFELKRDDWACSRHVSRTTLQPVQNGSRMDLVPMTQTECVEYRRIGE